jgi:uncharacterized protein (DUF1919 family)
MKIKSLIKKSQHNLVMAKERARLKNRNFTIISNNCWGAEIYRQFNLPYHTPFVGLFIFPPCYIKLLKNLRYYLGQKFDFIEKSSYRFANDRRDEGVWQNYPIGILGKDIEIHFMHYSSVEEAVAKWNRRLERIEWDKQNIFVQFSERALCTPELIEEFDRLNFANKICFTSKNYTQFKSCIWIEECKDEPYVVDGKQLYNISKKYFNLIDWLDGGNDKLLRF